MGARPTRFCGEAWDVAFRMAWMLAVAASVAGAAGGDWPQWRGPARTGVAAGDAPLADAWPEGGPPMLWQSEPIPGGGEGGYGSPVVADGRVYLYVSWKYTEPIPTRTLTVDGLKKLGWRPEALPPDLADAVEKARLGEERAGIRGKALGEWIEQWVGAHLDAAQEKALGGAVKDRLKRGGSAIGLKVLERLETIKDKAFPSQEELDAWFDASGVVDELRKDVMKVIATGITKSNDVFVCLDGADGKTLWKATFPGRPEGHGTSSTPCVRADRVYATGSDGQVFCLDAGTGDTVWSVKVGKGGPSASPLVVDGVVVVAPGHLMALDAQTGGVRWEQAKVQPKHSSPAAWRAGARTWVIARSGKDLACVDADTGEVLWQAACGEGDASPVVAGDRAVVMTSKDETGLVAFRLSPEKGEKAWTVPLAVRGATPVIYDGRVYAAGAKKAVCVDLESGKVVWESEALKEDWSSPAFVSGRLLANLGGQSVLMEAGDEGLSRLGRARLGPLRCTSPAVADGRLYIRQDKAVACYDLGPRIE